MYKAEVLMRTLGVTQAELSRRTGIHKATINHIIRGHMTPYPRYQKAIAEALAWGGEASELFEVATVEPKGVR